MNDATAGSSPARSPGTPHAVLEAFSAGALTTDDIGRATGLDRELVRLAIDQLTALGLITSTSTSMGCPDGVCTGCSAPTGNGCESPGPEQRGRLMSLSLTRRPGV